MAKSFVAPSGAQVVINPGDFEDAMALHDAVLREAAGLKLDLDLKSFAGKDFNEMDVSEVAPGIINSLLPVVMKTAASKEVKAALMLCLGRCTYSGERISVETFKPEEARQDYYSVIIACLKVNLSPFFGSLLSVLKDVKKELSQSTQKSA